MENVCINNGYHATKVKTNRLEFKFDSKVTKALDKFEANLEIGGELYKVGAGQNDLEIDKTTSFTQKACIMYALKKASADKVNVMSALPINTYSNAEASEKYKDFVMSIHGVNICELYPEGAAAVLSDIGWYKDRLVCLIDVGGLTANSMIFDNGAIVPGTAFSCQLGSIILENRIRMALQRDGLVNIPDYQIRYVTENKSVKNVLAEYIEELKLELRKMNYPTNIEYRFTGGGSLRFQDLFNDNFKAYISKDAVWENVRGLWLLSEVVWREN